LIYKGNSEFTARVTDFGYATRFVNEDDRICIPKIDPWNAPEHTYENITPAQAQKMDVFSFGMLCMWVMFEKCLSGITPLPQEAHWAEKYVHGRREKHLSQSVLKNRKQEGGLVMLAQQLVMAEKDLDDETKQVLQELFSLSLACNPSQRKTDLRYFSDLLPAR
jgi:serine/threonine protein kinase